MEPGTAWSITKTAAEITRKLYALAKTIKDRELKERVDTIADELVELKRQASELEDENRELREKARFKSDEFEFRMPFYYSKAHRDRSLCPRCFAKGIEAPIGEEPIDPGVRYRSCLACGLPTEILTGRRPQPRIPNY